MKRILLASAALGALAGASAGAQTRDDAAHVPLTLRVAIATALRNNPDVRISRTLTDSASGELRTARAWPNPQLAIVPNVPYQYSATLPIDIGPQRSRRTAVASLAVDASRLDTRESERQLAASVARGYYDVLLADARAGITSARREVVRQLVASDSARVRAGDLPERALIRSQVELIRADAELARNRVDAQAARLQLQGLMGVTHPDTVLALEGTLRYADVPLVTSDSALAAGVAQRPDVVAAQARVSLAAAAQGLAAASMIPIPQLSIVHQFGAPFESGSFTALGIGFEVPILTQYGGLRDRAAAGRTAAEIARQRAQSQAQRDVSATRAEYLAQRALVQRYEAGVVPKVEENVQATRYAYTRGAASLLEVLDALRAQQDVLTDYYSALHDYWVSVYAFEAASGLTAPAGW